MKLVKECDEKLKNAEENVNKILNKDGTLSNMGGKYSYIRRNIDGVVVERRESSTSSVIPSLPASSIASDKSIASLEKLSADNANYYNIVIDHQPRKMEAASSAGYDLYVAGHTHTGQLFPNRLITKKMYRLDYGRKEFGNLTAITSNGYGFWGVPVRTEVAPELVVINLKAK